MKRAEYNKLKMMTLKERIKNKWSLRQIADSMIEVEVDKDRVERIRKSKRFI
jgi:hypothetical protein